MAAVWTEYKSKSGQTLFIYNKITGQHKWHSQHLNSESSEYSIVYGQPVIFKELCSVATQTDDCGCSNGCTSMYISTNTNNVLNSCYTCTSSSERPSNVVCELEVDPVKTQIQLDNCIVNKQVKDFSTMPDGLDIPSKEILVDNRLGLPLVITETQFDERDENPSEHLVDTVVKNSATLLGVSGGERGGVQFSSDDRAEGEISSDCKSTIQSHRNESNEKDSTASMFRTENGQFQCSICSKMFVFQQHCVVHLKRHCKGEKRYKCSFCDKAFSNNFRLTVHLRIHTGEKPFRCVHCNKAFHRKDLLVVHQRVHTGEKPYTCSVCDKRFGYKCDVTVHLRTHTGEKPYQCPFCERSFRQRGQLTVHLPTHNDEKPYRCSICDKAFKRKKSLNGHLERKHYRE